MCFGCNEGWVVQTKKNLPKKTYQFEDIANEIFEQIEPWTFSNCSVVLK